MGVVKRRAACSGGGRPQSRRDKPLINAREEGGKRTATRNAPSKVRHHSSIPVVLGDGVEGGRGVHLSPATAATTTCCTRRGGGGIQGRRWGGGSRGGGCSAGFSTGDGLGQVLLRVTDVQGWRLGGGARGSGGVARHQGLLLQRDNSHQASRTAHTTKG